MVSIGEFARQPVNNFGSSKSNYNSFNWRICPTACQHKLDVNVHPMFQLANLPDSLSTPMGLTRYAMVSIGEFARQPVNKKRQRKL